MSFFDKRPQMEEELERFYQAYPVNVGKIEREMNEISSRHPEWLPYRNKALIYETAADRCSIKIFRHYPFYFELQTGRPRGAWGPHGLGGWMTNSSFGLKLAAECEGWWKPWGESGLCRGFLVLDNDHFCVGNDNVFHLGLLGIIAKAEERLKLAQTEKERSFLESVIIGHRSVIAIAGRFADEARRMSALEESPDVRVRLDRIADTAANVPSNPPSTFFEALNTILFMREMSASLEGVGVSILGHLDRILYPYYTADLAAGRITREEAKDLISYLLAMSDVRFDMRKIRPHVGTNTTVMIGGCDSTGTAVFNDITRMIVEAYKEHRFVDPKLNARISEAHPEEYFDLLAELVACGTNALCMLNDEVIIPANVRMGKAVEDCRLYVSGGCQENVLENTEINSRATIYHNAVQVFLMGFSPERWAFVRKDAAADGARIESYMDCESFEALYDVFLRNLKSTVEALIDQRNSSESEGWRYNPCPMHSGTISDCIENAKDIVDGGARYSYGSVSLTGVGTLVDSLYAVRRTVFENNESSSGIASKVSLEQLKQILMRNYQDNEAFRQYLANGVAKYGHQDDDVRRFAGRVFADIARVSSGRQNSRGGKYEASLFAFRSYVSFAPFTGATPDGRKEGEYLSQGMSPSLLSLGRKCEISQVLDALETINLSDYPVAAVLDVKLPAISEEQETEVIVPVIKRFLRNGGSVLQINYVDPEVLLDARRNPEKHPDLVVRVSGYSAYFNTLPEAVQDEVIERSLTTGVSQRL
jgi:trans-4-hydroxy-L-proline dehydratase